MVEKRLKSENSLMIVAMVSIVAIIILMSNSNANIVGMRTSQSGIDIGWSASKEDKSGIKGNQYCKGDMCSCVGAGPEYCPSFYGEGTCCDTRYQNEHGGNGTCCAGTMDEQTGNCIVSLCSEPGKTS
jgi:hypothetical protein